MGTCPLAHWIRAWNSSRHDDPALQPEVCRWLGQLPLRTLAIIAMGRSHRVHGTYFVVLFSCLIAISLNINNFHLPFLFAGLTSGTIGFMESEEIRHSRDTRARAAMVAKGTDWSDFRIKPAILTRSSENKKPFFDSSTDQQVITSPGVTAYLHCRVRNLGSKVVSIKQPMLHLTIIGINDERRFCIAGIVDTPEGFPYIDSRSIQVYELWPVYGTTQGRHGRLDVTNITADGGGSRTVRVPSQFIA